MSQICLICKERESETDYGLCKKCDQWMIDNREEIYKIKQLEKKK